jgi:hypothetical protein
MRGEFSKIGAKMKTQLTGPSFTNQRMGRNFRDPPEPKRQIMNDGCKGVIFAARALAGLHFARLTMITTHHFRLVWAVMGRF